MIPYMQLNEQDSEKMSKCCMKQKVSAINHHLDAKLRPIECLSGIVGNVGSGRKRTVDGEMEEIRVVQIEEIHRQIRRQICRDVSPAARLMVVIQAKHDGESWKVKLQKNLKKEK